MGDKVDLVRRLLEEKPMTLGELSMRVFEEKYTCSDKETLRYARKMAWGRSKASQALNSLQRFNEVEYTMIPCDDPRFGKEIKLWSLKK